MNLLDMRTVIFSYALSNLICAGVMAILWKQNHKRFAGLGFWLTDFVLQFIALVLVILRGVVPDFLSMTVSNALTIGGTLLLYVGLGQFTGKPNRQAHNFILLAVFIAAHAYYAFAIPSLLARNLILSLGLMVICFQCAWLMLRQVGPELRVITSGVGQVFLGFCLISLARIIIDLFLPQGNDFFHSGTYDTLLLMTYQMLFIILTYSLFLMVNRRLFVELDSDIAVRKGVESALRFSEEKFSKAFQSSPDAILITRLNDGKLIDVNEGFSRMTEYSREEALTSSSIALGLWVNPSDREIVVAELEKNQQILEYEFDFRAKSGRILNCLYSAQLTHLGGEAHILSVVREITEHKRITEALQQREELYRSIFELTQDAIVITTPSGQIVDANPATSTMFGYTLDEVKQLSSIDFFVDPQAREQFIAHMQRYGKIKDNETWLKRRDGKQILVLGSGAVLQAPGMPTRLLNTLRDITERNRTEEIVWLRLRLWEYAATQPIDKLMQKALDEIGDLTHSPIGFYHFVSEDQSALSLQAWSTRTLAEFCKAEGWGMHYPINEAGVWTDCVHQRKPVIHNDYASLPHRKGMPDGHAEVIRELVVPTMRDNRVVSILGVGNKPTEYDEQDIELVEYIADVIWTIVEQKRADEQIRQLNARLEQLAMTDELTRVANRRAFFMRGSEEIKRAQRYQLPLSLLMLDIDEFKQVNDTYGHDAGDKALQRVAGTLQTNIREIDMLARLGGEEFGILLPNTKAEEATRLAERLRMAIEKETCYGQDDSLNVTVSIGIAKLNDEITNIDHLLKNADIAMYRAKNQGRNQVVYLG